MHVDGGARGNPGPAAAGAVLTADDGTVLDRVKAYLGPATNNEAEYRAVLLGLRRAAELGVREVHVVNDSELIARQLSGAYRVRKPELKPLHAAASAALREFERWSIETVPRERNAEADALVNEVLDEALGT